MCSMSSKSCARTSESFPAESWSNRPRWINFVRAVLLSSVFSKKLAPMPKRPESYRGWRSRRHELALPEDLHQAALAPSFEPTKKSGYFQRCFAERSDHSGDSNRSDGTPDRLCRGTACTFP